MQRLEHVVSGVTVVVDDDLAERLDSDWRLVGWVGEDFDLEDDETEDSEEPTGDEEPADETPAKSGRAKK